MILKRLFKGEQPVEKIEQNFIRKWTETTPERVEGITSERSNSLVIFLSNVFESIRSSINSTSTSVGNALINTHDKLRTLLTGKSTSSTDITFKLEENNPAITESDSVTTGIANSNTNISVKSSIKEKSNSLSSIISEVIPKNVRAKTEKESYSTSNLRSKTNTGVYSNIEETSLSSNNFELSSADILNSNVNSLSVSEGSSLITKDEMNRTNINSNSESSGDGVIQVFLKGLAESISLSETSEYATGSLWQLPYKSNGYLFINDVYSATLDGEETLEIT